MDIRKYGIAIAVAILTAIFIYATADAIAPQVDYNTCYNNNIYGPKAVADRNGCADVPLDTAAQKTCQEQGYQYEAQYSADGCVSGYTCNTCYKEQENRTQSRNQIIFYVSIALGLVFIVVGFLLPLGSIHEWVGLGFIMGGVIGLFIGTVAYWSDLARWLRPIVIALELAVVLAIVYKRMSDQKDDDAPAVKASPVQRKRK